METASTEIAHVTSVKGLFSRDDVKQKFQEMLGKRSASFITSVLQIVASNQLLSKADPNSVYHSAAVAATLDLPLNNNLGFAYIVPYNQKQPDGSYSKSPNSRWATKDLSNWHSARVNSNLSRRAGFMRVN